MSTALLNPHQNTAIARPKPRQIERLLAPLNQIAERSPDFITRPLGEFESDGQQYTLPRYIYLGQRGGGDVIRIGIFATIHGDEPEGALALGRFFAELDKNAEIGTGYALYVYPICNPTGFEDNTRHSRSGKDLNREFWTESREPEIHHLESEICMHAFDGIITLHSDDTSDGLYAFVGGAVLTENLTEPALRAAERFLPRNKRRVIDGFNARRGIVSDCYSGVLKSVPGLARPPFEITFETPQKSPLHLQVEATAEALQTILVEYRHLMAIGQNI